jgi:signal transduction histidine kinase/ActR/RegA family two-component response regulator
MLNGEGSRVLVCAPYGRDAEGVSKLLSASGHEVTVCADPAQIAAQLDDHAGVVLVTAEALRGDLPALQRRLAEQPVWSDVPFVILIARDTSRHAANDTVRARLTDLVTNIILLERPLSAESLLSSVDSALRARHRQFELRDRVKEIERAAETLEEKVQQRTADLQAEMASRARAEAALRQSQKMEAIGHLTGGIAHDFNNMLTGIIGSIDIIRRRIATGRLEGLERYMDAAWQSAQRAAALTHRLLAFSRRQSLDSKPIDANALVGSLRDLLERTINESIVLELELSKETGAVVADANQLESSILNLAINARDAMPNGGTLKVATRRVMLDEAAASALTLQPRTYVVVTVTDTGIGMSQELIEQVFDPFFTTKPAGQGTGLGLSMVLGFAQQSGGQVRIQSTLGKGTSVEVFLPAAARAAEEIAAEKTEAPAGDGQTILVVEDDDAVRLLVVSLLDELGYKAIEVSNPRLALPILQANRPIHLMVSDYGMPGMNGRELADVARKHRPALPILFVTGYAETATVRSRFLGENMDLITKPFTMDVLAEKMKTLLAQGDKVVEEHAYEPELSHGSLHRQ